ncbi:MAG: DUF2971 domain-containing protein [Actinomycetota bacterium]|jgi:hypothetical protein|nr:DUF2971 domain-containing protein [Actinomycetota bacterium]
MHLPGYGLLYHYTSATAAVESILPTGQLRLGLFEFTNDPRESKRWYLSASVAEGVDFEPEALESMSETADRLLRRSVKLACFTEDALPRNELDYVSGRGFGHSRLWSHYAGNHSGVCIGFDRAALLAALTDQLEACGPNFHAPVDYVEDPSPPYAATHVDVEKADEFGVDAVIAASVERHWRELFFTKDLDWASEHEYRWVVLTEDPAPIFVDVSKCVRLVVAGDSFPATRLPSVRHAARSMANVEIATLKYMNGRPHLLPLPAGPADSGRPYRRSGDRTVRTQALVAAEREAMSARADGEHYAAPALAVLLDGLNRCVKRLETLDAVVVNLHETGYAAVPLKERQRAAGVARGDVVYSGGRMCVVENQPQYSFTFVASVAAQALTEKRLRLHAVIEMEGWLESGNEQQELWRGRSEVTAPQDPAKHAVELSTELEQRLDEALSVYDLARRAAPTATTP